MNRPPSELGNNASRSGQDRPSSLRFPDWLSSRDVACALLAETGSSTEPVTLIGALVAGAREVAEDTVTPLARRYDEAMAQHSIRYKRRQQVLAALLGVALAAALNINVIAMAGAMSADQALRQAIVGHTEAFVTRVPPRDVGHGAAAADPGLKTTLSIFAAELGQLQMLSSLAGFGCPKQRPRPSSRARCRCS